MKKKGLLTLWVLFSLGCSNPPYHGQKLAGPEDFVIDSYKIRQGKFSILELEGKKISPLSQDLLSQKKESIQDGDLLSLIAYHPYRQEFICAIQTINSQTGFKVTQGHIQLPSIGCVFLKGLSLEEAREKIETLYATFLPGVEVFLTFKTKRVQKVELLGQVGVSTVIIDEQTRLFDVLAQARISPEANLFKSYVIRDQTMLAIDLSQLIREGDMSQNISMQDGDKIYIADASSSTVMMLGELNQKGLIQLPGGTISLREAIAKAGGIPFTGDKAYIQVIRGSVAKPKIYTLHWKHILELPADSMLLIPGDIVYVAATPITEWNRFVSQLFPSFSALDWFNKGGVGVML